MQKKLNFEILSWLFAMVFCVLFIIPIYMKSGGLYPFYISNAISIIVFLTFTRLIFLLSYTPYSHSKWLRMVLIFLPIPLFMYQIDGLFEFQKFVDEEGTISFFKGNFELSDYNFGKYIKYQYIFFSVAALVTIVLLPIRMIISFWRTTNTVDRV
jgi:glucan phosphoethanolaminetransferase (alkaline phosphatase superfamily)